MIRKLHVLLTLVLLCACAGLPSRNISNTPSTTVITHEFPAAAIKDEKIRADAIPALARQALAAYVDDDPVRRMANQSRLQLLAGDVAAASTTLNDLRKLAGSPKPSADPGLAVLQMYVRAKATDKDFATGFAAAFAHTYAELSAREALDVTYWLETPAFVFERNLGAALSKINATNRISAPDALALLRAHLTQQMDAEIKPLLAELAAADDMRRYDINKDVLIRTPDGATLSAMVLRPKNITTPLPAILLFNIYTQDADNYYLAKIAAARGYVGVVADTRGKRLSPDPIEPFEHEVDDTDTVINWISQQAWSNANVGMYGGSYSGYAAWAATKKMHPALKTIVAYAAALPGHGLPMQNNVFLNANYGWAFYVGNNKYLDFETYNDPERWNALEQKWYASGRPYRELDQVDGTPNPMLQRWLKHPAFDAYWQAKVPFQKDFARINIPVLSITGYYDDGQVSALHYLKQHYQHQPNAEHYLVIGPYDHGSAQAVRKPRELRGYILDPVAQFDTQALTFDWFDHVLLDGPKPAQLKDRVNYQVMGADVWQHAPSLRAMSTEQLRLFLTNAREDKHHQLARAATSGAANLVVDLADRKTSHNENYPDPVQGAVAPTTGLSFISRPFDAPVQINGALSGKLKITINRQDVDLGVALYEVQPDGTLFHLSYFLGRASFAMDMSQRRLLRPGELSEFSFDRSTLVSRQLQRGSRLLVVLDVNKNAYTQINYGTGRDVSDESIADAGEPLTLGLASDSYVEIPLRR